MSEEIKNSETENIETPAVDAAPEKTEAAAETAAPETPAAPAAAAETTEASTETPAAAPARRPDSGRGNARPQHRSSGDRGDRSSFQRPNRFRRKSCRFCHDEKIKIEYKNPDMLEKVYYRQRENPSKKDYGDLCPSPEGAVNRNQESAYSCPVTFRSAISDNCGQPGDHFTSRAGGHFRLCVHVFSMEQQGFFFRCPRCDYRDTAV